MAHTMKMLVSSMAILTLSTAAFAQTATPRVNEVDQRLQNQQTRTDAGVANGTVTARQVARDNARDAKVANQLSKDEAKNNGHVTKGEQARMNKELNHNSNDIAAQKAQ